MGEKRRFNQEGDTRTQYSMIANAPISSKKTYYISSRLLTGILLVNAACLCLYIGYLSGSVSVLGAPLQSTRTSTRTRGAMGVRMPRVAVRAEPINDVAAFKASMNAKYPDEWAMAAEPMYNDVMAKLAEKQKFIETEVKKMGDAVVKPEALEEQGANVERGVGAFLAPVLLLAVPIATLIGLSQGVI